MFTDFCQLLIFLQPRRISSEICLGFIGGGDCGVTMRLLSVACESSPPVTVMFRRVSSLRTDVIGFNVHSSTSFTISSCCDCDRLSNASNNCESLISLGCGEPLSARYSQPTVSLTITTFSRPVVLSHMQRA